MSNLGGLVVSLEANIARFESDLGKAAQIAEQRMRQIDKSIGLVKSGLAAIGVGFVAGATFDTIKTKIEGAISSAAGLQQLSERTGATVESLSGLAGVAKLSGTDTEALATGLQKLSKSMIDAQNGGQKTSDSFAAISISTKDIANQKPDEVFKLIAQRLATYQDGAEKTVVAQNLLGKAGANLLPVLKDLAEAGDLQVKVTTEQAAVADEYEKNLGRLRASTDAIYKKIGLELVPVFNAFTKALLQSQNANDGIKKSVNELAQDGSIREWAEGAAKVVAFVVDAFDGVSRAVQIVGKGLAAEVAIITSVMNRDFKVALQIGKDYAKDVDAILNKTLFSDRLKKQLEESRNSTGAAGQPRAKIDASALGGSSVDVAKAQMESAIKALDKYIQLEAQILQQREAFLSRFYQEDKISITDYYAARAAVIKENLDGTVVAYDKEIAAARKFLASTEDAKEKISAQTKITEIQEKRQKAVSDAGFKTIVNNLDLAKSTQDYGDKVEQLNIKLLDLQGNYTEAARRQEVLQSRQTRNLLTVNNDAGALAVLDQLKQIDAQKAAIRQGDEQGNLIQQQLATAEGRINLERSIGMKSELQSLAETGEKRKEAAAQLSEIADQYERIAASSGDPRLVANAEAFRLKVDELAASSDVVALKFNGIADSGLSTFFEDVMGGTKSVTSAFRDMANNIAKEIDKIVAKELSSQILGGASSGGGGGGLFGMLSSFGASFFGGGIGTGSGIDDVSGSLFSATGDAVRGRRAGGGPVDYGAAYLVGEKGPELFVPGASGAIIPNGAMGGRNPINVTINVPQSTDRQSAAQIAAQTGMAVNRALRRNT